MALSENDKSPTSKRSKHGKKNRKNDEGSLTTAHDWRNEKNVKLKDSGISPVEVEFYDDGTVTFFW